MERHRGPRQDLNPTVTLAASGALAGLTWGGPGPLFLGRDGESVFGSGRKAGWLVACPGSEDHKVVRGKQAGQSSRDARTGRRQAGCGSQAEPHWNVLHA